MNKSVYDRYFTSLENALDLIEALKHERLQLSLLLPEENNPIDSSFLEEIANKIDHYLYDVNLTDDLLDNAENKQYRAREWKI